MKRILLIFTIFTFAFCNFSAFGAETFTAAGKVDYSTETITVSGNLGRANEKILITDENPSGEKKIQHQRSFLSEEDGSFSYTYKINNSISGVEGIHKIYLTSIGNTTAECTYYYEKSTTLKDKIELFIKSDATALKGYLDDESYKEIFNVKDNELYKKADREQLANACIVSLSKLDTEEELQTLINSVSKILLEHSLLCAYENSQTELLFKDGEMLYKDIIKAEEIDSLYKVSAYEIYENIVNDAGKQKIKDSLMKKHSDLQAFHKEFIEKTLFVSITNANKNGYGHIKEVITSDNLKYLGISFNRTLTDDNAMTIAARTPDFSSAEELQLFLNSLPAGSTGSSGNSSNRVNAGSNRGNGGYTVDKNIESVTGNPSENEIFTDMINAEWAKEAVYALYNKGIVSGIGEKLFAPSSVLLREQIAKILCLSLNLEPAYGESQFADVESSAWYAPYVNALVHTGVIKGKSETYFGVGESVTREELCAMIYRAMPELFSGEYSEIAFSDTESFSDYSLEAVKKLAGIGIVNGYADGSFRPRNNCTRAEAAKIIYSVLLKGE